MSQHRRGVFRWSGRAIICIFVGAVLSLATAWALAALSDAPHSPHSFPDPVERAGRYLLVETWRRAGRRWVGIGATRDAELAKTATQGKRAFTEKRRDWGLGSDAAVPNWALSAFDAAIAEAPTESQEDADLIVVAAGWPWASVKSVSTTYVNPRVQVINRGEWDVGRGLPSGLPLPYLPIWPGIVLNTLTFSLVPLAIGILFRTTQRWHRRRKGLCLCCRYNRAGLAADAKCPECGTVPACG
jgi:hypothetical protein